MKTTSQNRLNAAQPRNGRKPSTKHNQRGNGLLYALLGSALLAIGGYFAFNLYQDKSLSAATQSDITNVQDIIQASQRLFGQNNDYAAQGTASLVQAGAIPNRMRLPGTNTAINSFSQPVACNPNTITVANDSIRCNWPVPRAACTEFATALANSAQQVIVGNTLVKGVGGQMIGALAAANCDAQALPVVSFDFGRFAGTN